MTDHRHPHHHWLICGYCAGIRQIQRAQLRLDTRWRRFWRLAVYELAEGWWRFSDLLDKIPGFAHAMSRVYNDHIDEEEEE